MKRFLPYVFPVIALTVYLTICTFAAWDHQLNGVVGYGAFVIGMLAPPQALVDKRLRTIWWLALVALTAAWLGLWLAVKPPIERTPFYYGVGEVAMLGMLAGIAVLAWRQWKPLASTPFKSIAGILIFIALIAIAGLASAILVGKMIGGWHSLSLSEWGMAAVILWLPLMFLIWFGLQKWQTYKHES